MTEQEQFALLESVSDNTTVFDAYEKAFAVLGDDRARTVCASISGGADSDIVLDMCTRIRKDIEYVWFNTGLEYQATKDHLKYLEEKYGIKIHRVRAVVTDLISLTVHLRNCIGNTRGARRLSGGGATNGAKGQDSIYRDGNISRNL